MKLILLSHLENRGDKACKLKVILVYRVHTIVKAIPVLTKPHISILLSEIYCTLLINWESYIISHYYVNNL